MNIVQKKINNFNLVLIIPLLFTLMPRPPIDGTQFLTYPALGLISLYFISLMAKEIKFEPRILNSIFLLIVFSFCIALSVVFSNYTLGVEVFVHILKPFLFITILIFGYFLGINYSLHKITQGLLKAAYFILIIQIIVGVTQLFDIHIFEVLYSSEKTRPLGGSVRIAGTLGNPNIFAWIVIQMALIIFLFETKRTKISIFVFISFILVFFSGSRSLFIIFPFILLVSRLFLEKKNIAFFLSKIPKYFIVCGVFFVVVLWFLRTFGEHFPYLNQIFIIFETGTLKGVSSFEARTVMWDNAIYQINSSGSMISWIFGLGAGTVSVVDNDFLYTIANYGLLGLLINLVFYVYLYRQFSKLKFKNLAVLGKIYLIFSLVLGYQADTLSGWNYPILLLFYAGLTIALCSQQKKSS